jgi:hypothetical protein
MDLAGPGDHINRSNLVLESKADMQKRGQASPDDGDALALTFAQEVAPAEVEEHDDDERYSAGMASTGKARGCDGCPMPRAAIVPLSKLDRAGCGVEVTPDYRK